MTPNRRSGYTLLEVLLATTIAVILVGALYVTASAFIRRTQIGRETVEQATLVRALFARMDNDAAGVVNLSDATRFRMPQPQANTANNANTGTTGTTTTDPTATTSTSNAITLPLSVQGDATTLHLYVTRTPRELLTNDPNATSPVVSDLRRISYWFVDQGGKKGLARQESKLATSDDATGVQIGSPPNVDDETTFILADEVRSVQFRYYGDVGNGPDWQTSWDCTAMGADGVTPLGPPRAIEVTLQMALPRSLGTDGDEKTKTYRHVIHLMPSDGSPAGGTTGGTSGGGSTP
jgi:prepilin-type N-terminal cleavage/methylation domain-containing protein